MLKGAIGLAIRYLLYAIGAGLAGAGAATLTIDGSQMCLDMAATARVTADAIVMIVGGSSAFGVSFIWSRIAKRLGGVT